MNPGFRWTMAETAARTTPEILTRRCPKCGRKQVAPKERLRSNIKCEHAGQLDRQRPSSMGRAHASGGGKEIITGGAWPDRFAGRGRNRRAG